MNPSEHAPMDRDPFGFAALQKEFNALLCELEEIGGCIARRRAEEKANQLAETASR